MNVAGRPRSNPSTAVVSPLNNGGRGVDVNMYTDIPSVELSLDQFEEYALARLKILRKIEDLKTRNAPHDQFKSVMTKMLKDNLPTNEIDTISHFILRAAYCRTEDLRRWFLAQECKLFSLRLESSTGNLTAFLTRNGIHLDRVSEQEKEDKRVMLLSVPSAPSPVEFNRTEYYRVRFTEALRLVSTRDCYLEKGYAYVPLSKVVSIVESRFRSSLSKSLAGAAHKFDAALAGEGERLAPLLKGMNAMYTGSTAKTLEGGGELTAATVDGMAERSMPLCMSTLHGALKRDHKLKHQGRLQYGLFLKGAGMTMEEHMLFFQREFTKLMTGEQFNKQYAYSIRHMHGKEGKRASYTPYNCMKIIMGSPPGGAENHGCPFKHYDEENLGALLGKLKIGTAEKEGIMKLKKEGNFQLACAKHFEVMHPGARGVEGVTLEDVGNHPNAWLNASCSYYKAKEGRNAEPLRLGYGMEGEAVKEEVLA